MINKNWWITGLVETQGTFSVKLIPHKTLDSNVQIVTTFSLVLSVKDIKILYSLRKLFSCGIIKILKEFCYFQVKKLKNLSEKIIPFFDQYFFSTQKKYNYWRFRWIVEKMYKENYHRNPKGLDKILKVKRKMNKFDKIESNDLENK